MGTQMAAEIYPANYAPSPENPCEECGSPIWLPPVDEASPFVPLVCDPCGNAAMGWA